MLNFKIKLIVDYTKRLNFFPKGIIMEMILFYAIFKCFFTKINKKGGILWK